MQIIITSPSLNINQNVSGISSVTRFITDFNNNTEYIHFELGKRDNDKRNVFWLLRIVNTYYKWVSLLVRNRKAMVHFNLAIDKFGLLRDSPLILFARLIGKRIVLHLHGGEFLLHKEAPKWMTILLNLIFSGKSPAIVLSAKEAEVLKTKYKCKKVFVLPNCVDLTEAKKFDRTINETDLPVLLFMGRISLNKGLEYIFKALKALKEEGYAFKFYMAGKGPEEKEYVQKFTELLGADFTYEGVVTGESKVRLLKTCNIFLLPSFFEGLPIALLESMSFGLIPIATAVGSIKYLINNGDNGLIVQKRSSDDIASAIKKLSVNSHYMQALSINAKQSILDEYDPDKYLDTLNSIYAYE